MMNEPNNPTAPNDRLDALLRDADEYVPDDGFTARVLSALPARRRKSWLRLAILGAATVVATALAVWWLPPASDLLALASRAISQARPEYVMALAPVAAAIAAIFWGLLALAREEE